MKKTQLYFWKPLMESYKKELSMVTDYYNRTKPVFGDSEKEATEYANHIYEAFPANEDTDPAMVAEFAFEEGLRQYEVLEVMKRNHLLMTISMLCQIWEQQLIKFTMSELNNFLEFRNNALSFNDAKKVFETHGLKVEERVSWNNIREMRMLVNTIKHGEGGSARRLRAVRPDFFEHEHDDLKGTDTLELAGSVLLDSYSLNVKEDDFAKYVTSTEAFWEGMPERAFSDTDSIINAFKKKQSDSG
ncbi:hypothetical protein [Psychrobacillus sp. FSL K6-1415]|uniref:hypothetical protein n=1 Tax=Psychrobacillus sp. FSL K6-1415 TaxID=2921544 RepID=UPI0030F5ABA2